MFPNLWAKLQALWNSGVQAVEAQFSADEKFVLGLFQPVLASAEANVLQDLLTFIIAVLSQAQGSKTLSEWETAVLNALEATGSELLDLATKLGSTLLQALIALAMSKLPTTHPVNAG